ncbi:MULTISPECIES: hypothetical protein [unclassified Microcoleus]|uniref:hypothetical protein n=1 Tax=unclassified Microcoleus TaxID=2642155 RepID=UPI002FD11F6E
MRLIKQAQSVRQGPPQAVMFLSRAVKGTKLKTEAMELLGKLAPTIKVLKSVVHQKQVIADSSGKQLRCGIWAVNLAKILAKSTADCLRKSWEP